MKINRYGKNFSLAVISYGEFDEYVSLYIIVSVVFDVFFQRVSS